MDYFKDRWNARKRTHKSDVIAVFTVSVATIACGIYYWSSQHQKRILYQKHSKYWSKTYHESRSQFRSNCSRIANARTKSLSVDPIEDLTIDLVYIPSTPSIPQNQNNDQHPNPSPNHLVVHLSGVHGIDAFVGSAIQNAILDELVNHQGPDGYDLLMIHSVNPFGFCHHRRVNRYNIDLDFNTIFGSELWRKYKSRDINLTACGHEHIESLIAFNKLQYSPSSLWTDLLVWWRLIRTWLRFGSIGSVIKRLLDGQYHEATGLFYGGFKIQKEQQKLFTFLIDQCQSEWNLDIIGTLKEEGSKLTVIDVQDGFLRESEDGEIGRIGTVRRGIVDLFRCQNPNGFLDGKYGNTENESTLNVMTKIQSFTMPSSKLFALYSMITENNTYQQYLNGGQLEDVVKCKQRTLKQCFFVEDDMKWKYQVIQEGIAMFDRLSHR